MDHKEMASRGGKSTASKLTPEERSARAKKAAAGRWGQKDGAVEKAIRKSKTREPYTGPSKTPIKGEVGMPGHGEQCQCMACRAHRQGWRP